MQSKQYFTKIKNYPHEKSTEPKVEALHDIKKSCINLIQLFSTGGEARTPDTRFWRPVLYQLSYSRVFGCKGSVIFEIYKSIYEKYFFFYSFSNPNSLNMTR